MKKKKIIIGVVCILFLSCAVLAVGSALGWWTKKTTFKEKMLNLMENAQIGNENFIGFSLINANDGVEQVSFVQEQSACSAASSNLLADSNVAEAELQNSNEEVLLDGTLVAFDENYNAEEVYFEKIDSVDNISLKDIEQYGKITQFCIMDQFMYVQITDNNYVDSNEVVEKDYFAMSDVYLIFVIDLQTRNVYLLNTSIEQLFGNYGVIDISMENGLIGVNLAIIGAPYIGYYSLGVENGVLKANKVANDGEFYTSHILKDKHGNIYLVDNDSIDYNLQNINMGNISIFTCEDEYSYFSSTDKTIYRALKSSKIEGATYYDERYTYVEALQADRTWVVDNSTSDKIIRNQITDSGVELFCGGDFVLIDGNIVRIAQFLGSPVESCHIFGGKLYALVSFSNKESLIYIGDINQIDTDFTCFEITEETYLNFESVIEISNSSNYKYLSILNTRTGFILEKSDERYKILVNADGISFEKITPIFNGFEVLSEIIYS